MKELYFIQREDPYDEFNTWAVLGVVTCLEKVKEIIVNQSLKFTKPVDNRIWLQFFHIYIIPETCVDAENGNLWSSNMVQEIDGNDVMRLLNS